MFHQPGRKRCMQSLEYFVRAGESLQICPDNALANADAQ
jgi:hypothetical protein